MERIFLLFLGLMLLVSCKKETETFAPKTENKQKPAKKATLKPTLQTFAFPAEVEGCSCYFAENRQEFIKQNYIYVDDFQKNAFIKINSELMKIPLNEGKKGSPGKQLNISIKNDDYSVELKAVMIEEGEIETQLYKGTITVTNLETKQKIRLPVYGECGC